jgi:predicted dehydrogenase
MSEKTGPQIAVIGCGYWGANHARTLSGMGALAALGDRNPQRAIDLATEFGARALSPDDIISSDTIDGVVLALPADQHPKMGMAALEAGKHVMVEKPMALAVADAQAMVTLADERDLTLMTGHILRYHAAFEALARLVANGAIGELQHIQSNRLAFGKFHERFDALWDLGPHDLSLVLGLTDRAPQSVDARMTALAGDACDAAHLDMMFSGGVHAHIHVSRHSAYKERRFAVTGSKGMIVWDDFAPWPEKVALYHHDIWSENGKTRFRLFDPDFQDVEPSQPMAVELAHFRSCIETGSESLTSGRRGLAVLSVLEMASQAA